MLVTGEGNQGAHVTWLVGRFMVGRFMVGRFMVGRFMVGRFVVGHRGHPNSCLQKLS